MGNGIAGGNAPSDKEGDVAEGGREAVAVESAIVRR